jgi:DNA-binding transcriptional ArsR family regulator
MEIKSAAACLSALAHERRLAIFRLLVQAGEEGVAAGEIARRLNVLPNTMSASLSVLSHAGLVDSRRDGRSIVYTANYESMRALMAFLMEDCCAGSPDICAPIAALAGQRCVPAVRRTAPSRKEKARVRQGL